MIAPVLKRPTLVLNRNWQPVGVATVARSLVKLWNGACRVVDPQDVRFRVVRAGYTENDAFTLADLWQQAQTFRADEIVWGTATRLPDGGMKLDADIVLDIAAIG